MMHVVIGNGILPPEDPVFSKPLRHKFKTSMPRKIYKYIVKHEEHQGKRMNRQKKKDQRVNRVFNKRFARLKSIDRKG
jgi:hypothetical protein